VSTTSCFAIVAIGAAVLFVITRSPFGAALNAIRENRQRAAFIGLRVRAYELAAFTIASSLAAVAGALYAVYDQQAFPGLMFWTESGIPVLMVLIGGSGVFFGPALGAVFYTFLAAKVQSSTIYWDLIIGSVLLFIVLALPGGLASLPERARAIVARVRKGPQREVELEAILAVNPHPDPPPQAGERVVREKKQITGSNGHLLVVRGLSKHFMGLRAVDGVDLDVKTGRVHAVICLLYTSPSPRD